MRKIALAIALLFSIPASATVTTQTRTQTFSPSVPTTVFTISYPFVAANQLKVTKITVATNAEVVLTQGVDYTVRTPIGTVNGYITTTVSVTSTHQIRIDRVTPQTQTIDFSAQGTFRPKSHEDAFDKLTMMVQELSVGVAVDSDIDDAIDTHEAAADPHTGFFVLAGRSGGQIAKGDTASGGDLTLQSTSNATRGSIYFGGAATSEYDEVNDRWGLGTANPTETLDVDGDAVFVTGADRIHIQAAKVVSTDTGADQSFCLGAGGTDEVSDAEVCVGGVNEPNYGSGIQVKTNDTFIVQNTAGTTDYLNVNALSGNVTVESGDLNLGGSNPSISGTATSTALTIEGGSGAGDDLRLHSTSHSTKGSVFIGTASAYQENEDELGIGTTSPTVKLDVRGAIVGARGVETDHSGQLEIWDCGKVMQVSTSASSVQLDEISSSNHGCVVTVLATMASGTKAVTVTPAGSDAIYGTCVASDTSTTEFATDGAGEGIQCEPAGAQNKGDYITMIAINGTNPGWYIIGCAGTCWHEDTP